MHVFGRISISYNIILWTVHKICDFIFWGGGVWRGLYDKRTSRDRDKLKKHIIVTLQFVIIVTFQIFPNNFITLDLYTIIVYLIQMKFSSLSQYFFISFACQTITLINIINNILEKSVIYNTVCVRGGGGVC